MGLTNNILSKISLGALAVGLVMGLSSIKADASTVMINDDDIVNPINVGTTYQFDEIGKIGSGAGDRTFTFVADAADTPLPAMAANFTLTFGGVFVNPKFSWFDGIDTTFGTIVTFNNGLVVDELMTTFTDPDRLTQILTFSWDDYSVTSDAQAQISISVSAVPLPAGGLLLLTALGGVAALRRKRKAA